MDFSIVAMGVTFPLTFSISQAFNRRERALAMMAELKATLCALYWHHRDWCQDPGYPASLGNNQHAWAREFSGVLLEFVDHLQHFLMCSDGFESVAEVRLVAKRRTELHLLFTDTNVNDELGASFLQRVQQRTQSSIGHQHLMSCYRVLSKISVMNEYLTFKSKYVRGGEGGMSRSAQYLRYLVAQMDALVKIKEYRTPAMLRHACSILVHVCALLLAPYFNHVGFCDDTGVPRLFSFCPAPYVTCLAYVIISMLLLNVQAGIEQPFDQTSVDDVLVTALAQELDDVVNMVPVRGIIDSGSCFAPVMPRHGGGTAGPGDANGQVGAGA